MHKGIGLDVETSSVIVLGVHHVIRFFFFICVKTETRHLFVNLLSKVEYKYVSNWGLSLAVSVSSAIDSDTNIASPMTSRCTLGAEALNVNEGESLGKKIHFSKNSKMLMKVSPVLSIDQNTLLTLLVFHSCSSLNSDEGISIVSLSFLGNVFSNFGTYSGLKWI